MKPIAQVLAEQTPDWLRMPGVLGTAEGLHGGKPCILVLVAALTPELRKKLPRKVDGYGVKIQETGEFRAREGENLL